MSSRRRLASFRTSRAPRSSVCTSAWDCMRCAAQQISVFRSDRGRASLNRGPAQHRPKNSPPCSCLIPVLFRFSLFRFPRPRVRGSDVMRGSDFLAATSVRLYCHSSLESEYYDVLTHPHPHTDIRIRPSVVYSRLITLASIIEGAKCI